VSLRLHLSGRAAAEAEKAAEWDKQQRVWLKLEVGGNGHVHVQLRVSPFPKLKRMGEGICTEHARPVWEAQARGRMQLIKEHRAQGGVGAGVGTWAGSGAGAGGGRGLGKSCRSWSQ